MDWQYTVTECAFWQEVETEGGKVWINWALVRHVEESLKNDWIKLVFDSNDYRVFYGKARQQVLTWIAAHTKTVT